MARNPVALPVSYGQTDAVKNSGGYLVNMLAEVAEKDAKTPVTLTSTPGTKLFLRIGDTPIIQMIEVNGAPYAVTETGFYRVFSDGGSYKLGAVVLNPRASIETNGLHIVVTDGKRAFYYTIQPDEQQRYDDQDPYTNFVTELTGQPFFYEANTVTFLDQRMVFPRNNTNQFFNSDLLAMTFPNAFTSAESNPDYVVAVIQNQQQLVVIGEKSTEWFYDSGTGNSPWQRVSGAVADFGTRSPYTVAKIRNVVLWLDQGGAPVMANGYSVKQIGSQAIVDAFAKADPTDIMNASAYCYSEDNHDIYVITVGELTFGFDLMTGLWHRRSHYDYGRHIASCCCYAFGKNLVGSFVDGSIYEMSQEFVDDDGRPLVSIIEPAPMDVAFQNVALLGIELDIDVGYGDNNKPAPKIGMEMSRDAGKSFGNQREGTLGFGGDYSHRVRWQRNGAYRQPRIRFTISDPVPRRLVSRMWIDTP